MKDKVLEIWPEINWIKDWDQILDQSETRWGPE